MACIFCGKSPTTNAHIFREAWIAELVPGGAGVFPHRFVRRTFGVAAEQLSEWKPGRSDIKVNCVCQECNGGWMDQLDREAEDLFLTRAVIGYPAKLSLLREKEQVARWCVLVAVLFDQMKLDPTLDTEAHKTLYCGAVPHGTRIWLARTEPPPGRLEIWGEPREWRLEDGSEALDAHFMTFGVNHLAVAVFVPTERTPQGIEFEIGINVAILRALYPETLTPFIWPPPQTLPWDQVDDFKTAFEYLG